jgi:hypothetical protein
VAQDAKQAVRANAGELPALTQENVAAVAAKAGLAVEELTEETGKKEKIDGYLAVGVYDEQKRSFRNFEAPPGAIGERGAIAPSTVIRARWSTYLRANTANTESGMNPILGIVSEGACVQVVEALPSVRGQTWAAVRLVSCPP